MREVEIVKEYKQCWHVGQRREVTDEFAAMLIEAGYAKPAAKEEESDDDDR